MTGDAFDCEDLLDPENGRVDTSGGTTEGSVATYTCNEGYNLKGESSRTCTTSGWSGKEPSCESEYIVIAVMAEV